MRARCGISYNWTFASAFHSDYRELALQVDVCSPASDTFCIFTVKEKLLNRTRRRREAKKKKIFEVNYFFAGVLESSRKAWLAVKIKARLQLTNFNCEIKRKAPNGCASNCRSSTKEKVLNEIVCRVKWKVRFPVRAMNLDHVGLFIW